MGFGSPIILLHFEIASFNLPVSSPHFAKIPDDFQISGPGGRPKEDPAHLQKHKQAQFSLVIKGAGLLIPGTRS